MSNKKKLLSVAKATYKRTKLRKRYLLATTLRPFFTNRGNVSPKLRYLHTNHPTLLSFCKPPIALACAFASPWHNAVRFGITGKKAYLCLSKKRKGAGLSSFRVFGANYPIWAGKIIL